MQTVNIHAAKIQLSRLVEQAAAGEEIIIALAGRPLARLVPLTGAAAGQKRVLGVLSGELQVPAESDTLPIDMLEVFEDADAPVARHASAALGAR
ncbi:type II toxin-antitoxin system Phd/YefM family antitoxin [Lichenicoccus sp.]|uniref:type II toxin-antitoxin system Phd/YefM family antitoxin n=1 Tax=Lichenicoccus sp. TaxID=2781899 RepID=UPI003D0AE2BB